MPTTKIITTTQKCHPSSLADISAWEKLEEMRKQWGFWLDWEMLVQCGNGCPFQEIEKDMYTCITL